ncbi:MAG: hypothetical protein GY941_21335 [Planctomycetes bacterium]|nr:hypothetical protein [Planctomycetota bacterium]
MFYKDKAGDLNMTNLQKWILKKIAKRVVIQGNHRRRTIEFYSILVNAARNEFTEDNKPILDSFLNECCQEALSR